MADVQLLRTPWEEELRKLAASAVRQVRVCAPFVKREATESLLDALSCGVHMRVVSCFNTGYFHRHYSDTAAFRDVLDRSGQVRNCQQLHAKLYLFDEQAAIVTSANLTGAGLLRNWEYGVVLRRPQLVDEVAEDFEELWSAHEDADIDAEVLDGIDEIVACMPPPPREPEAPIPERLELTVDEQDVMLEKAAEAIIESLTGWKREVFEVLLEIEDTHFSLAEVYERAPRFAARYPDNENIEAKIRQQLQFLRDLGLVKFVEPGRYKKLWT